MPCHDMITKVVESARLQQRGVYLATMAEAVVEGVGQQRVLGGGDGGGWCFEVVIIVTNDVKGGGGGCRVVLKLDAVKENVRK